MAENHVHSGRGHWRATPGLVGILAILAVGVAAGFARAALIVPLHVPLDPNEGWVAYHAAAAMRGNPYPPAGSFLINNYPPLSFYLVGAMGSWFGDNVAAGRIVSLTAFASVCALVAIVLQRMNAHWRASLFALLFLACTLLLGSDYVGMNDPQLLGHTLQLAGLLLLMRHPRTVVGIVASAALFVVAGLVKHNLFALPLACVLWLFLVDRWSAVRLAAALLALSLASLIAVDMLLSVNLLRVLNSPRLYSLTRLADNFVAWLPITAFPLCGFLWLFLQFGKDRTAWLVSLYTAISIVSGTVFLGGAGVDMNAMFDADIALALCAGVIISRLLDRAGPLSRATAQLYAALCIFPFASIAVRSTDWRDPTFWFRPMQAETAMAKRDIAFLRTRSGNAMCEDLTFCYWAGKRASVDVFNLDQEFETGARDAGPFARLIRSHVFGVVELDETTPFPFPGSVEDAFLRNYRIDHQDDEGTFFVPR